MTILDTKTVVNFERRPAAVAGAIWLLSGVLYLCVEAITAASFPGYSFATNYISDLGVPDVGSFQGRAIDSPLHALMNAAFISQGILFLVAAIIAARAAAAGPRRSFVIFAGLHAVGIVLVGSFPGSQASVENGLAVFHFTGALLAIIGGNAAAILAGIALRRSRARRGYVIASVVIGILGLLSLLMLVIATVLPGEFFLPDGIWERGAVDSIMVWEIVTGFLLLATLRGRPRNVLS